MSFHCKSWYRLVPYHMILYKPKERIKIVLSIELSFRANGSMVCSLFGAIVWSLLGITMGLNLFGSKWGVSESFVLCYVPGLELIMYQRDAS